MLHHSDYSEESLQESPWMTKKEAARYLGFDSPQSLDSRLIQSEEPQEGKIRSRKIIGTELSRVRLWREDVYALLPLFESRQGQPELKILAGVENMKVHY